MEMVRHCPQCGTDYRPDIPACADCGGSLVDRLDEEDVRFQPPPEAAVHGREVPLPPGEYRSIYFSHNPTDLAPLAERLAAGGIPFGIHTTQDVQEGRTPWTRYDLAVRDEERESAIEAIAPLLGGEAAEEARGSVDRDFDPESGYRRCPACSASLTTGTVECPGCGLVLGVEPGELVCSTCGTAVGPADGTCPGCGAPFEE